MQGKQYYKNIGDFQLEVSPFSFLVGVQVHCSCTRIIPGWSWWFTPFWSIRKRAVPPLYSYKSSWASPHHENIRRKQKKKPCWIRIYLLGELKFKKFHFMNGNIFTSLLISVYQFSDYQNSIGGLQLRMESKLLQEFLNT